MCARSPVLHWFSLAIHCAMHCWFLDSISFLKKIFAHTAALGDIAQWLPLCAANVLPVIYMIFGFSEGAWAECFLASCRLLLDRWPGVPDNVLRSCGQLLAVLLHKFDYCPAQRISKRLDYTQLRFRDCLDGDTELLQLSILKEGADQFAKHQVLPEYTFIWFQVCGNLYTNCSINWPFIIYELRTKNCTVFVTRDYLNVLRSGNYHKA